MDSLFTKELENNKINYQKIKDDSIFVLYNTEEQYDINFIVPVRGRLDFANAMYKSFCKAKEKSNLKIAYTVVEYSEIPEHSKFCKQNKINYIWIKSEPGKLFNKCLSLNFGALFSVKSKSFLFHDLDCLIQSDFFNKLSENLKTKECHAIQCFHGRRVLYLNEHLTNQVKLDGINVDDLQLGSPGVSLPMYIGAPGGSIYIEKNLFFEIGGYDPEFFSANAPEDIFFWNKIETIDKIDICDNPQIDIFHMNHPPTYYSNPFINEMKNIHTAFVNSVLEDKKKIIELKKEIIKSFY